MQLKTMICVKVKGGNLCNGGVFRTITHFIQYQSTFKAAWSDFFVITVSNYFPYNKGATINRETVYHGKNMLRFNVTILQAIPRFGISIRKIFIRPIWFENYIFKMASSVEKRASHYLILPRATVHPINLRYGNMLGFVE